MFFPFRYWRSLLFSETPITSIRSFASIGGSVLFLLLTVFFQALPLTKADLYTFHLDYASIFIKFLAVLIALFIISKILGSKASFKQFIYTVSFVMMMASFITAVLAYISLFVFAYLLNTATVSNLITSLLPYYLVVLFGFSSEAASELPFWRSVILGILGVVGLYGAYFFL